MNFHCWAKTTSCLTLFVSQASLAQTGFQTENISTEAIVLTQATEEKAILGAVKNRFGGQFTTGAGVGYESSFGSISGFIPFLQMPGQELFYFDGRLNFDTEDANPSGSALVGYRQYSSELNVVFGGYIGTDLRETNNETTFSQIGVGFEALGDPWEIRANGYIPVGDRREVISESVIPDVTSLNFQDHFLLYDATQSKVYEESLMGLEIEGGIRLFDWAGGDLRGYLGTYLYDTPSGSGFVGFNSRLLARISDNFSTGLSLSTDGQFGTNLVFTVGASFGGNAPAKRDQTLDESILARLGDALSRQSNVAVRQITEAIALNDLKVTNPVTGDPWYFVHVSPRGNSEGTFEAPFGTMPEAIAAAPSDPDTIIYVDDFVTTPGDFTIPNFVQVLSRGPEQRIDTNELGNIQIPLSGNGNFPFVNGTVTMGNNTVLSGFTITPPAGQGAVVADGITNASILDNIIENLDFATGAPPNLRFDGAIQIANTTGNVEITRNIIRNINDTANGYVSGIEVTNITGNLAIADNTIEDINFGGNTDGAGIFIDEFADVGQATISITGNTISRTSAYGIYATYIDNDANVTLDIVSNQITNIKDEAGIYVGDIQDKAIANITIADNTLTNINDDDGIDFAYIYGDATANINVSNNTLNNIGDDGIDFDGIEGNANATITVSNNSLTNIGEDGIDFAYIYGEAIANISILNNTLTNISYDGVNFSDIYGDATANISIANNTLTNISYDAIFFDDFENNANITLTIENNIIDGNGGETNDGIGFSYFENNVIANITVTGNTITGVDDDAIYFDDIQNSANATVAVSGNIIDGAGGITNDGIEFYYIENNAIANITVTGNTITGVDNDAIYFEDIQGNANATITIANNIIDGAGGTTDDGIEFSYFENNVIANITVTGNRITGIDDDAIYFGDFEDNVNATVIVSDNIIDGNGGITQDGIDFDVIENQAIANITVTGNTITGVDNDAIYFDDIEDEANATITIANNIIDGAGGTTYDGIEFDFIEDNAIANITVMGNRITGIDSDAIFFSDIQVDANATVIVSDNIIDGNGGITQDGIEFSFFEDQAIANITITGNRITGVDDDAIYFDEIENDANVTALVSGNIIDGDGAITRDGIEFDNFEDQAIATITITNNMLTNLDNDGINVTHTSTQDICLALTGNTVTNPGDFGFEFTSTGGGDFQILDRANLLTNNIGSFDPIDINTNASFADGTAGVAPCP